MRVHAYAKINWSLNILGIREDGYHELDMLMQQIDLHDTLELEPAARLTLHIAGSTLPADDTNLVLRAARLLNETAGTDYGADIRLTKRIPAQAGLGGGSADCAAALLALDRLWGLGLSRETLLSLGLRLGADVPFCLMGGLCTVRGIGERLQPLPDAPRYPLLLITPGMLPTGPVFRAWDRGGYPIRTTDMDALAAALRTGSLEEAARLGLNALEPPAIELLPEVGRVITELSAAEAPFVRMTGSGSTVFAAFYTEEAARRAACRLPGSILAHTMADSLHESVDTHSATVV